MVLKMGYQDFDYNLPANNAESPTLASRTFLFNPISLKCQKFNY